MSSFFFFVLLLCECVWSRLKGVWFRAISIMSSISVLGGNHCLLEQRQFISCSYMSLLSCKWGPPLQCWCRLLSLQLSYPKCSAERRGKGTNRKERLCWCLPKTRVINESMVLVLKLYSPLSDGWLLPYPVFLSWRLDRKSVFSRTTVEFSSQALFDLRIKSLIYNFPSCSDCLLPFCFLHSPQTI